MKSVNKSNFWNYEHQKEEIEKIIADTACPKDFECYKNGFENLCRVKLSGAESVIECLDSKRGLCTFSLAFGYSYFCQCPVRVYIAKNFNR